MAYDISNTFLRSLSIRKYPLMHARILAYPVLMRYRQFLRKHISHVEPHIVSSDPTFTDTLETTSAHFREHGWAWINPIFPPTFWESLTTSWPPRMYFDPPRMITKSYDVGLKWNRGHTVSSDILHFQVFHMLLKYLQSSACGERLSAYVGRGSKIDCNSFLLNETYPGSCVIPHRDTPLPGNVTPFINTIFFIDGTGGECSGQLALSHDAAQDDIFFTPPTLRNACLVYDTQADFYHGFKPVAPGKFRRVITASFSPAYTGAHIDA